MTVKPLSWTHSTVNGKKINDNFLNETRRKDGFFQKCLLIWNFSKNSSCFCRLDKERSGLILVLQNQTQIKKVDESNVKPLQFTQNFYLFPPATLNFCGWDKIETESKQAGFAKAPQLFSKNKIKEIL